jgi:hypothetical protein
MSGGVDVKTGVGGAVSGAWSYDPNDPTAQLDEIAKWDEHDDGGFSDGEDEDIVTTAALHASRGDLQADPSAVVGGGAGGGGAVPSVVVTGDSASAAGKSRRGTRMGGVVGAAPFAPGTAPEDMSVCGELGSLWILLRCSLFYWPTGGSSDKEGCCAAYYRTSCCRCYRWTRDRTAFFVTGLLWIYYFVWAGILDLAFEAPVDGGIGPLPLVLSAGFNFIMSVNRLPAPLPLSPACELLSAFARSREPLYLPRRSC